MTGPAETRLFWDRRAVAWQQRAGVIDEHLAAYGRRGIEALHLRGRERVLDVGCGVGYCAGEFAGLVGCEGRVVGVDLSPAMIAAARATVGAGHLNVSFRVADAQTAELGDGLFDAAYARFSITGARWISAENARDDIAILFEEGGALSDAWAVADPATREACYQAVIDAMAVYREPAGWRLPGVALLGTGSKGD